MKLEIFYSAGTDFSILFDNQLVKVNAGTSSYVFEYEPQYGKTYSIVIRCESSKIMNNPVEISKIIFDEFWELDGNRIAFGRNVYSDAFIKYAELKSVQLDHTVRDNTILFFMGDLIFEFFHPIRDFIHAV